MQWRVAVRKVGVRAASSLALSPPLHQSPHCIDRATVLALDILHVYIRIVSFKVVVWRNRVGIFIAGKLED